MKFTAPNLIILCSSGLIFIEKEPYKKDVLFSDFNLNRYFAYRLSQRNAHIFNCTTWINRKK